MSIPDNFIQPDTSKVSANAEVQKAVFGSLGKQYVRFYRHNVYSSSDSVALGKEVSKSVDICEIQNDKFTKAAIMVNDLSPAQKFELAALYEQFKGQKDSTDTAVLMWDAVTENEKAFLLSSGVSTVEQLNAFGEEDLYRLGVAGKDLKARAARHMITKDSHKKADQSEEIKLLMEENAKMKQELKAREEAYFAKLATREKKKSPLANPIEGE